MCFRPEVYFFWKFVPKVKIVCWSWNLKSRLIWICRIRWWFPFFLVWKYTFCVNLIQKFKSHFKTKFGTYSWVSNRRSSSPPLINFLIFFFTQNIVLPPLSPLLINYWGKFSTRVWNDILILTYLWPCKRSEPSVVCFVLQVRAKKPTQCFVL